MLTRAVARGTARPLIVADMPFGSFQPSDEVAVQNAVRFMKDGGADAVKLEGAGPMLRRAEALVDAAVPVIGHIGLTPQSVKLLGGYKPQGRTAVKARRLADAARALERAGCFAIVLEAIPAPVAAYITKEIAIPTIGIGAGLACDGQVLVWHDLMGISTGQVPRFVKRYAEIGADMLAALEKYVNDVRAGRFPEDRHTYPMAENELDLFEAELIATSADEDD
jgi:3-methyl-2-oxobutanoate hydroxymethyltransferase